MGLKIRKTFSLNDLFTVAGLFFVVSYALLEHVSIPIPVFSGVKLPLLYAGGICVLSQINTLLKNIMKRKYFFVCVTVILMVMFLVWSMLVNKKAISGFSPVTATLRTVLYLIEVFAVMILLAETGKGKLAIKFVYGYVLGLVLATDLLLFAGWRFISGKYEYYLVGTKFTVIYMHMALAALWMVNRLNQGEKVRVSQWRIFALIIFFTWMAIRIDCISGLLGSVMLFFLLKGADSRGSIKWRLMTSPGVFVLCMLCSVISPFIISSLLELPFITYILEEVLGRSTTLTGRLYIYDRFIGGMEGKWLLGYGYGSGNVMSSRLFGYGYTNAQNALLYWILQSGILTSAALTVLAAIVIRQLNGSSREKAIRPLAALIYVFIFLGMIETTFSMSWILWFALVFLMVNENQPQKIEEN